MTKAAASLLLCGNNCAFHSQRPHFCNKSESCNASAEIHLATKLCNVDLIILDVVFTCAYYCTDAVENTLLYPTRTRRPFEEKSHCSLATFNRSNSYQTWLTRTEHSFMRQDLYLACSFKDCNIRRTEDWQRFETIPMPTPTRSRSRTSFWILVNNAFHVTKKRKSKSPLKCRSSETFFVFVDPPSWASRKTTCLTIRLQQRRSWKRRTRSSKTLQELSRHIQYNGLVENVCERTYSQF